MPKKVDLSFFINQDYLTEELSSKEVEKLEEKTPKETDKIEEVKSENYGQECIIDLHEVPIELFTNKIVDDFAKQLVEKLV